MDYTRILKRAWHLVKSYRALWVFGVILALTTFSWETAFWLGWNDDNESDRPGITVTREPGETFLEALQRTVREEFDTANEEIEAFFAKELDIEIESDLLVLVIVLLAVILIGYSVAKIASYVGDTALIRMVDEAEKSGVRHSVRGGFRLGWSRAAWRFFLMDVLIAIAVVLSLIVLLALVFGPLALWTTGSTPAGVFGTVITVILFFPGLALVIVAGATIGALRQFFRRACALEGLSVRESLARGYAVARQHLRKVVPVWLVTVGVGLAWPFLMIPVGVLLLGLGVVLGGLSALLVGGLAALAFDGATPLILAGVVGIPIFILALAAPLAFLSGLREVFLSSTWTLTYRELLSLESAEPERVPRVEPTGLEGAPIA